MAEKESGGAAGISERMWVGSSTVISKQPSLFPSPLFHVLLSKRLSLSFFLTLAPCSQHIALAKVKRIASFSPRSPLGAALCGCSSRFFSLLCRPTLSVVPACFLFLSFFAAAEPSCAAACIVHCLSQR